MAYNSPFQPAGGTGASATVTVAASTTTASGSLADSVTRGQAGASTTLRVFNATSAIAFWRVTKGSSSAVNTDTPVGPGVTEVFTVPATVDTFSVILSAGTGNVYATLGEGM